MQSDKDGPYSSILGWIASCEDAVSITGEQKECYPKEESAQKLKYLQIYLKTFTELPSGDYVMNYTQKRSFNANPLYIGFPEAFNNVF